MSDSFLEELIKRRRDILGQSWSSEGFGMKLNINVVKMVMNFKFNIIFVFILIPSQMLAYSIYIIGSRKFLPDEAKVNAKPQRDAFKDAKLYFAHRQASSTPAPTPSSSSSSSSSSSFSSSASSSSTTGARKAEHLHGRFYINIHNEEERRLLDEMLLKPIIHVGEVVAGDEKLFRYTAHHMNTKAVSQKKDVSFHLFSYF
jgi:hypothetical protein